MLEINADLHLHSPYSLGVSKLMTLDRISLGARHKGIGLVGTGDALQPDWGKYLEAHLRSSEDGYLYGDVSFVLTTEIEDTESIHHVIIIPDFETVSRLRSVLRPYSDNIDGRWGGRPRVGLGAEQLAGICRDLGALIGPAHAFTPYKSLFREGKYTSLSACYGDESDHVHFLELGLSADTEMADHIPELERVSFICSSDAHSPSPNRLGREFVRLRVEHPTFEEVARALRRESGRCPTLNVGLDPRLGKYFLSFCSSCRRTLVIGQGVSSPTFDDLNIYINVPDRNAKLKLLRNIQQRAVICPACGRHLRLGVNDRVQLIGGRESRSPRHRPPYIHMPPLLDLLSSLPGSTPSTVWRRYRQLLDVFGNEVKILVDAPLDQICKVDTDVHRLVRAYRLGRLEYQAGGGGRYGTVRITEESTT